MLFNSYEFILYFIVVVSIYFSIPFKYRNLALLLASYYFYMQWSAKYALLIMISTLITYFSGMLLEKSNEIKKKSLRDKSKKTCIIISFSINLGILFFYKYFNFINENLVEIANRLNISYSISNLNILLPVGISFYTFQALGYTVDIYRGDLKAEKNFVRYALFVSFFPQLVAGPIERSTNLIPQFYKENKFNYERARTGLLIMLWGFFKKIVIADRLGAIVNTIYNTPKDYKGMSLIIATIFFSFQIYCDFSSYSDIAVGISKVMGYNLMNNFERPYFATSIAEFWRKWHISLGTWFRDYIYFPLGGNKVSEIKRYRNIFLVFLISGLWHGASWNFIIWGILHGIYQIVGIMTLPLRDKIIEKLNIKRNTYGHKFYKWITTFSLVNLAWIFFRANTLSDAWYIIKNIYLIDSFILEKFPIEKNEFNLAFLLILFLLAIQFIQNKKSIIKEIEKENLWVRWSIYYISIFGIIILGYYGELELAEFIYFQF